MILQSTTVEIILYYLTRNRENERSDIYNSRNYSILLNDIARVVGAESTTVEIILYYLTPNLCICTIFLEPSNFIFIILYNICTIYVK